MYRNGNEPAGSVQTLAGPRTAFGAFELTIESHELLKHGIRVKLPPKSFELLTALLARPGAVVSREELRVRLWPSDSAVDFETGLNTAAYRLRVTLGDTADKPRYIETLPRVGYRFIAPVVEEGSRFSFPHSNHSPTRGESTPGDDLEAVRRIIETMEGFEPKEQERVLRWVAEKLGLRQPV